MCIVRALRTDLEYNVYEHECDYAWGRNVILEAKYTLTIVIIFKSSLKILS